MDEGVVGVIAVQEKKWSFGNPAPAESGHEMAGLTNRGIFKERAISTIIPAERIMGFMF